jgi:hypothetical protein
MRFVLGVGLILGACGGGGGGGEAFLGTYAVTSHRENHQQGTPVACDDPGPEVPMTSPFYAPRFALIVDPFFEDPDFIRFQECDDGGTCMDSLILVSPGGPGLFDESFNTQGSAGNCSLYAGRSTAALSDDGVSVTVEDRQWSQFDAPGDCTLEDAEALIGTALCQDVVVWVGTRVE